MGISNITIDGRRPVDLVARAIALGLITPARPRYWKSPEDLLRRREILRERTRLCMRRKRARDKWDGAQRLMAFYALIQPRLPDCRSRTRQAVKPAFPARAAQLLLPVVSL